MTGGAVGALFAQGLHLTSGERKTLPVAGATAGLAATFTAPLASILLAAELLLFELRPRSLVPVSAAVCLATVVRGPLLGHGAIFLSTAPLRPDTPTYALCVVSGLVSALLARGHAARPRLGGCRPTAAGAPDAVTGLARSAWGTT
jgi:H+/Cl- antiporter ClcA